MYSIKSNQKMKKSNYFLGTALSMAFGLILFTGCDSDNDGVLDDGPKVEPIVLECSNITEAMC